MNFLVIAKGKIIEKIIEKIIPEEKNTRGKHNNTRRKKYS